LYSTADQITSVEVTATSGANLGLDYDASDVEFGHYIEYCHPAALFSERPSAHARQMPSRFSVSVPPHFS
jgi:hypothetical protein